VSVAVLVLIPYAHGASHNLALPLVGAAIVLFSITWNIAGDPYQALMIDITPERRRSRFNAVLSILALVGQVAILVYASLAALKKNNIPNGVFWVAAAFILLCFALVFFGVREPESAGAGASHEVRIPLRQYVADLRRFTQAQKLLISVLFLWTGLNPIITWLPIFAKRVFHTTDSKAIIVYAVTIIVAGICAYPWGKLAVRFGSRNMIALGTLLLICAAVLGLVVPSYLWLFPLAALGGMGFSATTVLTFPFLSTLVPGSKMGVFTGLQAAVSSIAVPLSVIVTGVLIDRFGLRSIFGVLIVTMALDLAFLLRVDECAARDEVRVVEAEEARLTTTDVHPSPEPATP
jgi:MFS family permease